MRRFLPTFILSLLLFAILVVPFTRLVSAQVDLSQFLFDHDVEVGSETVAGYQQIYYIYAGQKTFITSGGTENSRSPRSRGQYVTFVRDINGAGQIFLHHIPSGVTTQLTTTSTNLLPGVDRSGRVVWEKWTGELEAWQIFYFDGTSISQLTSGDVSVNADIDDGYIVFDRHDRLAGLWRTVAYSTATSKTADINITQGASQPRLVGRTLEVKRLGGRETVLQDIANVFELNLPALPLLQPTP